MTKKIITSVITLSLFTCVNAGEIVHTFSSPSFSGVGYSSHVLTIEQLEAQRKQKLKDDAQAAADKAVRDYQSTNAYKFQNNLESRIYAQLSKQIADKLFGEGADTTQTDTWFSATTPFGDTVKWMRGSDDRIYVQVLDSNGNTTAQFDVPVGEFAF